MQAPVTVDSTEPTTFRFANLDDVLFRRVKRLYHIELLQKVGPIDFYVGTPQRNFSFGEVIFNVKAVDLLEHAPILYCEQAKIAIIRQTATERQLDVIVVENDRLVGYFDTEADAVQCIEGLKRGEKDWLNVYGERPLFQYVSKHISNDELKIINQWLERSRQLDQQVCLVTLSGEFIVGKVIEFVMSNKPVILIDTDPSRKSLSQSSGAPDAKLFPPTTVWLSELFGFQSI